ncbi:MAG: hypothetical protein A2297_01915 [Elusimicrobia bacterium RIFOXYB2_FULL_48_7]|nr:MAG: hypothetical protein A2297_01915 [Elusimicrobia bacterium RIFOXYB2_FULL_48_7]
MSDFKEIFKELGEEVADIAVKEFKDNSDLVINAMGDTFESSKKKMEEWMIAIASGNLKAESLPTLVRGEITLGKMEALKQKGLSQAKLDKFVNNVIDKTINKIIGSVL